MSSSIDYHNVDNNKVDPKSLTLSELKALQTPGYLWTQYINYNLAILITWLCLRIKVSAKWLTVSVLVPVVMGTGGLFLISFPGNLILFWIAIQLAYTIDCADGSLARATNTASPQGAYLDEMMDCCSLMIIGVGCIFFVYQRFEMNPYVTWSCVAFFSTRALGYAAIFLQGRFKLQERRPPKKLISKILGLCIDTGLWWFILPLLMLTSLCWIPLTLISILQAGNVARHITRFFRQCGSPY
ncbi:MAG: CDP-alcohol phosphatidyltransferase family protein [Planctomycetes bacterium]|nr:CDP-alcohol phosphatidyltransferase family protein [Planctomycetota bacterium]